MGHGEKKNAADNHRDISTSASGATAVLLSRWPKFRSLHLYTLISDVWTHLPDDFVKKTSPMPDPRQTGEQLTMILKFWFVFYLQIQKRNWYTCLVLHRCSCTLPLIDAQFYIVISAQPRTRKTIQCWVYNNPVFFAFLLRMQLAFSNPKIYGRGLRITKILEPERAARRRRRPAWAAPRCPWRWRRCETSRRCTCGAPAEATHCKVRASGNARMARRKRNHRRRARRSSPGVDEAEGEERDAGPQQHGPGEHAASRPPVVLVLFLLRAARPEAAPPRCPPGRELVRQWRAGSASNGAGAGVQTQHAAVQLAPGKVFERLCLAFLSLALVGSRPHVC